MPYYINSSVLTASTLSISLQHIVFLSKTQYDWIVCFDFAKESNTLLSPIKAKVLIAKSDSQIIMTNIMLGTAFCLFLVVFIHV